MSRVHPREFSACIRWLEYTGLLRRLRQWQLLLELTAEYVAYRVYNAFCERHATNRCFDEALRGALDAVRLYKRLLDGFSRSLVSRIYRDRPECVDVIRVEYNWFANELEELLEKSIEATREWLETFPYTKGLRRRLQCGWLEALVAEHQLSLDDKGSIAILLEPTVWICNDNACEGIGLWIRDPRRKLRRRVEIHHELALEKFAEAYNTLLRW